MNNHVWWRCYNDIINDPKIRVLAFEDRWHYVAVCSIKNAGELEKEYDDELRESMLAMQLGVSENDLAHIKRRLLRVKLIDENWSPVAWDKRQYTKAYSKDPDLDGYRGYVYFVGGATGDVKIGYSRNPWARIKELQTANPEKLSVVATIRTTEVSERRVPELFERERVNGEWFKRSPVIVKAIKAIRSKSVKSPDDLFSYVAELRSSDVATTTDTDTDISQNTSRHRFTDDDLSVAKQIAQGVQAVVPTARPPNLNQWADEVRLMRERDERTHAEILALFTWANSHTFWQTNILCPKTLRKQWTKLAAQQSRKVDDHETSKRVDNSAVGRVKQRNAERRQRREQAGRVVDGMVVGSNG